MKIFTNKNIRNVFLTIGTAFIAFMAVCIFAASKITIIISTALLCAATFLVLYRYFNKQNNTIENAEKQITEFIDGNQNARIECDEDGELYKLFHKVNNMSAILDAHIDREQAQKVFLKNTIADISHQLKTPLAALNIYTGIMQSEPENTDTVKEFSDLSEKELERIETLVQNLLKITKLDSGTLTFSKKSENISDITKSVKKRFEYRLTDENKKIILSGDKNLTLICDRDWLSEAIANIVKNALDHTKSGGVITIEQRKAASAVQIIIKDNGSGIHSEDLPHIFKRFYRSRFSQDKTGIGLGLPLAKAIIEAHNGNIEVQSELQKGTVFTITFLNPTKL